MMSAVATASCVWDPSLLSGDMFQSKRKRQFWSSHPTKASLNWVNVVAGIQESCRYALEVNWNQKEEYPVACEAYIFKATGSKILIF